MHLPPGSNKNKIWPEVCGIGESIDKTTNSNNNFISVSTISNIVHLPKDATIETSISI